MRVGLHVVQNDLTGTGMSTYVRGLVALLDQCAPALEVKLIVRADDEEAWRKQVPARYGLVPVEHGHLRPDSPMRVIGRAGYEFGIDRRARDLRDLLRDQVDVIHFAGDRMTPLVDLGIPATLSSFSGNYWTMPSFRVFGSRQRHWLAVQSARASLHRCKTVIVPSVFMRDVLVQHVRVPAGKIVVVPLVAWAAILHGPRESHDHPEQADSEAAAGPYLFYPSAHFAYKNHRRLVDALGVMVANGHDDVRLVMTGKPPEDLARHVAAAGLTEHVSFVGFVDVERLQALYRGATAVVHPSLYEAGGSLSMFEAMLHGVPVVCSNLGSMGELGGRAVRRFDPYDPADMARVIGAVVADEALQRELAELGRAHVRSFDAQSAADGTVRAYEMAAS